MIYIIATVSLLVLYVFGYLLDYLHQEYGFTIAMLIFVIGGLSFITFLVALIGA